MIHELKETKMQSRLDIILETVDMILEGSKRKWSQEKRLMHAKGTNAASADHLKRVLGALGVRLMRQGDDLGARGHPYNLKRANARHKLADMPGTGEEISGRRPTMDSASDARSKAHDRYIKKLRER